MSLVSRALGGNNLTCRRHYEALRDIFVCNIDTFFSDNEILVHHEIWVNKEPRGIYLIAYKLVLVAGFFSNMTENSYSREVRLSKTQLSHLLILLDEANFPNCLSFNQYFLQTGSVFKFWFKRIHSIPGRTNRRPSNGIEYVSCAVLYFKQLHWIPIAILVSSIKGNFTCTCVGNRYNEIQKSLDTVCAVNYTIRPLSSNTVAQYVMYSTCSSWQLLLTCTLALQLQCAFIMFKAVFPWAINNFNNSCISQPYNSVIWKLQVYQSNTGFLSRFLLNLNTFL